MKRQWCVLLIFFLVSLILRSAVFFRSVVDWDESLYLLVARDITVGNAPYTTTWDNKPPGIFALFSIVLWFFPDSVQGIRLAACGAVAVTAWLLYLLGSTVGSRRTGLMAGGLYLIYTSSSVAGGLASNTELFYNLFTAWAFLVLLSDQGRWKPLVVGLLLGIGFQINYHVVFDLLAALAIVGIQTLKRTNLRAATGQWGLMLAGFLIPLAGVVAAFLLTGHLKAYVDSTILANLVYVAEDSMPFKRAFWFLKDQLGYHHLIWLCSALIGLELVRRRKHLASVEDRLYIFVWFVMCLLSLLVTRRFWGHYFLHMLPPMCVSAAFVIDDFLGLKITNLQRVGLAILVLLATPLPVLFWENFDATAIAVRQRYVEGTDGWKDTPLRIAEYLDQHSTPDDFVYIVDYQPVIYFLSHIRCPTRYPFPSHLTDPNLVAMTGIDPTAELHAIMEKMPVYVIRKRDPPHAPSPFYAVLEQYLADAYVVEVAFNDPDDGEVDLSRRVYTTP